MIQFGESTRLYLVHGPDFLRPPEVESDTLAKVRQQSKFAHIPALVALRVLQRAGAEYFLVWVERFAHGVA